MKNCKIVTQSFVAAADGLTPIIAENVPEETVGLNDENSKQPEGRDRRADQNRRNSQNRRNRKRKKQLSAGTEATHEVEGAKTRDADASSIEFAHEPGAQLRVQLNSHTNQGRSCEFS